MNAFYIKKKRAAKLACLFSLLPALLSYVASPQNAYAQNTSAQTTSAQNAREQAAPTFQKVESGYAVTRPEYSATVNKDGLLSSLKVRGVETLGAPIEYAPGAKLALESLEPQPDGVLRAGFKGAGGPAQIDYAFNADGVVITTLWRGGGYADFKMTGSDALQGIELLNAKTADSGDSMRFVEQGEVRGVPAFRSSRNQMVRLRFPGFGLHTYVERWGSPFNYESAGTIEGRSWRTVLLSGNRPFPIFLTIQPDAGRYALPAIPFAPRLNKAMSLVYRDEPCLWTLDLGNAKTYAPWLDAGLNRLRAEWRVIDVRGDERGRGETMLDLKPLDGKLQLPITIQTPGSGWYQVFFNLTDPAGRMAPSQFMTRFTVINRVSGLLERPDELAGKSANDYATVALIGAGNVRESHSLTTIISNKAPDAKATGWVAVEGASTPVWLNLKDFDAVLDRGATESKKYGVGWFYQWNGRPGWMDAATMESVAFAMVSHGKDRCSIWEIENEPNFGYSPKDYLEKAVIPFYKGAKRADPNCLIMGPNCVGVSDTLRFMTEIYRLGGGRYFDILSTHTYPGPGESWEQHGNLAMLAQLRALMAANGDADKPMWQTEQGYTWHMSPSEQAARYATRQFLQGERLGIPREHQHYFYPKAHGFESWYQAGNGEEGSSDSWLPVAAAQRFMAENLAGTRYFGDLPQPYKGIYLSRFRGAKGDVIAAWTFDFPAQLPVLAPGIQRVVGYDGNPLALKKLSGGRVVLPLSGEPIYLHVAANSKVDAGRDWGTDLAAQTAGGVMTASATASGSKPEFANDGLWELWSAAPGLPARTAWKAAVEPTPEKPAMLEVEFPVARTVTRAIALLYLPAVSTSARDWKIEVETDGKWKTVAEAKDWLGWTAYAEFAPITTRRLRFVVTSVNDGWMLDQRWMYVLRGRNAASYTGGQLLVSAFEAYGPDAAQSIETTLTGDAVKPTGEALAPRTLQVQVQNNSESAFSGTLSPQVPPGFSAQPAQFAVQLKPRTGQTFRFAITPPLEAPSGKAKLDATLRAASGTLLDVSAALWNIDAPLEIKPQLPVVVADGVRQPALRLRNLSLVPLAGTVTVSSGEQKIGTASFPEIAPGENAEVQVVAPGLSFETGPVELSYTVRAGGIISTATQRVELRGWQVLGPFPNDFTRAFGPENEPQKINPSTPVALPDGKTALWQAAAQNENGLVSLLDKFGTNANASAYASVWVKTPQARRALASVGSDDGVRVWWNGANVWNNNAARGAAAGQDQFPVEMKAGWNHILLKITQGNGDWGFYFDLLDPETMQPLRDIIYASKPTEN